MTGPPPVAVPNSGRGGRAMYSWHGLGGDVPDVQTTTTYDAFGNVVSVIEQNTTNDLAEDAGTFQFDGLEMDVDDDALLYHQARFYDPSQGRWLDNSPLGFGPGDTNLYRYPHQE
jgi:RHS repeat-associated protein